MRGDGSVERNVSLVRDRACATSYRSASRADSTSLSRAPLCMAWRHFPTPRLGARTPPTMHCGSLRGADAPGRRRRARACRLRRHRRTRFEPTRRSGGPARVLHILPIPHHESKPHQPTLLANSQLPPTPPHEIAHPPTHALDANPQPHRPRNTPNTKPPHPASHCRRDRRARSSVGVVPTRGVSSPAHMLRHAATSHRTTRDDE